MSQPWEVWADENGWDSVPGKHKSSCVGCVSRYLLASLKCADCDVHLNVACEHTRVIDGIAIWPHGDMPACMAIRVKEEGR